MENSPITNFPTISGFHPLRVGFIRLLDAAPFIVAKELGLFRKHGLNVKLSREVGWATIRDKLIFGEIDACQALGPMPLAATLGYGSPAKHCIAAMVLNLQGNAITLSEDLWKRDVRDVQSLSREIRGTRSIKKYIFGVVAKFSSHDIILRDWLKKGGVDTQKEVQIVVLPPEQMVRCLQSGHIDGFCVGEPWNTLAIRQKLGWVTATSSELHPEHPEKVLMMTKAYADADPARTIALIRAIKEACSWCDEKENRPELALMLSQKEHLNCETSILMPALQGPFQKGHGEQITGDGFVIFNRGRCGRPSFEHGQWIVEMMNAHGHLSDYLESDASLIEQVFQCAFYDEAITIAA